MSKSDKTALTVFITAFITLFICALIAGEKRPYKVIRVKKRVEPYIIVYQKPDGKLDTTYHYQFLNE